MSFRTFQNEKKPFQTLKTRSLKSRKIAIFLKGLTHGFGPKMAIFLTSFFQAKQARKMSCTIFQKEKTPFQAIKTRRLKNRKIVIFLKGLSHGFWTEMAIFAASFFFGKIGLENVFYAILQRKNAFLGYKNKKIEKSKNCHFSKGVNPWFQFKNGHFFNFLFLDNKGQGNVFYDILERKNAFLGNNNKKIKKSKNYYFSKGVIPWCWSKNALFFNFPFLGNIGQGNFFYYILERKNAFLDY